MTNYDPTIISRLIDDGEKKVHTNSFDVSLNELADMVSENELILDPEFQRVFQWDEGSRSRFIESLLLELPVPPVFAVEESSGEYVLVDGLQRLSSYLHFRGQLQAPQFDPPVKYGDLLILTGCDIVTELNGLTYNDLPTEMQIRLKRSFLRMEVIKKSSDSKIKYHMFKRLNSGGRPLSDQQKRNASIRMLDQRFMRFVEQLSNIDNFANTTSSISDDKAIAWYDRELVIRFFAMKNWREDFKHDVREFISNYAESVALADASGTSTFNYDEERRVFEETFRILDISLGNKAFSFKTKANSEVSGFSVLQFEAITLGIQSYLDIIATYDDTQIVSIIGNALMDLKFDQSYIDLTTGGGKNSSGQFKRRIEKVEQKISEAIRDAS